MKESILSRLQVNNKSTKCATVYCLLLFTLLKRPVELRQIFGLDFILNVKHERTLICSLAVKNCLVVGCVGRRRFLAPLNASIQCFESYLGAQTLAIFSLMYQHTDEARSSLPFH